MKLIISSHMVLLLVMTVFSCRHREKADLILTGGKIYVVDEAFGTAEAMAIKDGKVLATGSAREIRKLFVAGRQIDLKGKTLFPGFIDAHCHFTGYGISLQNADLTGTGSYEETVERLKEHDAIHTARWILGRGWDQNDWPEKEFPHRKALDEAFPDRPVLITRIDGHAAVANRVALEMAGVNAKTRIAGGSVLLKDGEPTGVLIDNAIGLVRRMVPETGPEELEQALLNAQENCFAVGLTSVHDAGLGRQDIETIEKLQNSGKLKMRIYAMLSPTEENIERFLSKGIYKSGNLNIRSVKLFADGALGSRGAAMLQPYTDDPGNSGLLVSSPEHLENICRQAYAHGYQVNTHCIGDSANRFMLKLYGSFLSGKNDRRWRIEHAQVVHPDDFVLFDEYSIVPSIQTTHATSDMYWAEDRIGEERIKGAYAYRDLLSQNGWIPNGSDFPVEHINPLYGFYAGVVRKDLRGYPAEGFRPEQSLTREEALRAMTIWAARAAFEEGEKGSLEKGKYADFVVLDRDIMEIPPEDIPGTSVLMTFVNGEMVYGK